jgi:hypothetical protein
VARGEAGEGGDFLQIDGMTQASVDVFNDLLDGRRREDAVVVVSFRRFSSK